MWPLSTECAPCFRATTRTRSNTLPASLKVVPSVRRMPACAFFVGDGKLRRAVSLAPHSRAADDARRNTHRVPGQVRLRLATLNPAVSFPVVGCYESHSVGAVTARLARESLLRSCGSPSAAPRRRNELNRASQRSSRMLAENTRNIAAPAVLCTCWANVKAMQSVRGAAILKSDQILQKVNFLVTIRHRTDVDESMLLQIKGQNFSIDNMADPGCHSSCGTAQTLALVRSGGEVDSAWANG